MDKNKKKKVIIHISNIPCEVLDALREKYPDGYMHHVFKVTKPSGDFFHAVTVDTEDSSYLIKVDVKIDNITEDKLDDAIFSSVNGVKPVGKPDDEDEPEEEDDEEEPSKSEAKDDDVF
jgi:hypothetical protein